MDTGTPKRRWMLYAYIFLCIAIGLGGPMTIFRSGRPLTAFAFFVGSIIIFIMFGIRWFGDLDTSSGTWPPAINTCPDYLSYYERTDSNKPGGKGANGSRRTCIDTTGVSTRSFSSGATPITKWNGTGEGDQYYFDLDDNTETDTYKRLATYCQMAINAGVSWEGITDGQVCTFAGAVAGANAGAGDSCKKPSPV